MKLFFAISALALVACPAQAPCSPSGGATVEDACTTMKAIGCPEAAPDAGCVTVMAHALAITPVPVDCLAHATTPDEVRACAPEGGAPFVRCRR